MYAPSSAADGVHAELAEPFDVLLDGAVLGAVSQQGEPEAQAPSMTEVLGRIAEPDNDQTPRALRATGGLMLSAITPSQGVAGLNTSTLVQHLAKNLHEISSEVARWRDILAVPYQEYLLSK